jgi:membrane fusion protein (multidrug efflux system)
MKISRVPTLILLLITLSLPACDTDSGKRPDERQKITVATVQSKPVTLTQQYVCQIQSHHHIKVRAPKAGYLGVIQISEGQTVNQNDLLFQVRPTTGKDKLNSENQVALVSIKAPFNGIIDRLPYKEGSLVQKGETLTTLSDNSQMCAYFNIPEARYLEYKSTNLDQNNQDVKIELMLANGNKFDQPGTLGAIGAGFDFKTGNVPFRADFPNPNCLLRHGQVGTVLISRVQNDAIVIPQRATFEILNKRYVYVVDKDAVVHQREVVIQNELDDLFVVKSGVGVDDKIVVEGVRMIRDGEKVKYDDRQLGKVAANLE